MRKQTRGSDYVFLRAPARSRRTSCFFYGLFAVGGGRNIYISPAHAAPPLVMNGDAETNAVVAARWKDWKPQAYDHTVTLPKRKSKARGMCARERDVKVKVKLNKPPPSPPPACASKQPMLHAEINTFCSSSTLFHGW